MTAQSPDDRWAGLILLALGVLVLLAARLWWLKVVAFNRRIFFQRHQGPPRTSETINRWLGTLSLCAFGLAFLVGGPVWVVQGHP